MAYGQKYYNQWNGNDTLIIIHIGSNDIHHLNFECSKKILNFCVKNKKSINENINDIVDIIFNIIKNIYEIGGKNFMLMNIPPFELSPQNRDKKKNFYINEIQYFNTLLIKKANKLFNKYNDINIIIYNTNEEYRYIIKEYKKFNFKTINEMYKDNENHPSDDYFWNDYTHITDKGNKILAYDINDLLESINKS